MQDLSKYVTCDWRLILSADHVPSSVPASVSVNHQNYKAGTLPLLRVRKLWLEPVHI